MCNGRALLDGGTRCVSDPTRIIRSCWSRKELVLRLGIMPGPWSPSGVDADSRLVPAPTVPPATNFMPSPGTIANLGWDAPAPDPPLPPAPAPPDFFVRTGAGALLRRDAMSDWTAEALLARIFSLRDVPLVGLYSYSKSPLSEL